VRPGPCLVRQIALGGCVLRILFLYAVVTGVLTMALWTVVLAQATRAHLVRLLTQRSARARSGATRPTGVGARTAALQGPR
jgi:hypothetical protein